MGEYATHPDMRPDCSMDQKWDEYTTEQHKVWETLFRRQTGLLKGRACDEYMQALDTLQFGPDKIPNFEKMSEILYPLTGWQVIACPGLIAPEHFFDHLANRRFPVTYWIRSPEEMDYLEEPDLFHDLFGHVPLLANPVFGDYIAAYGRGGLKAMKQKSVFWLTRLFWYSVEFGLINTNDGLRIYGAGIVSSRGESQFALDSDSPNYLEFDMKRMMRTKYIIDDFQQTYFVIDSFEQLFEATRPDFTPIYEELKQKKLLLPSDVLDDDMVIRRGTGEYARMREKEKAEAEAAGN